MTIGAFRITGTLGAEIRGVDLSKPLSKELAADILAALCEYGVIFFRDQEITPEQHIAFSAQLGPVRRVYPPYLATLEGHPEVTVLKGGKQDSASFWHSDLSSSAEPPMASVLAMKEAPVYGGDTMFADMTAAYEALSDRMKDYLKGLRAVHGGPTTKTIRILVPIDEEPPDSGDSQRSSHPVVCTHPVTGRKILFVNPGFTYHIQGLPAYEADAILDFLFSHQQQVEFQCRWRWKKGDVGIWDNRSVLHHAIYDYGEQERLIYRTNVEGVSPS